jgi:hypothetical protein
MTDVRKGQCCYLVECESEMVRKRCEEKVMLIFFGEQGEKGSGMVECSGDEFNVVRNQD